MLHLMDRQVVDRDGRMVCKVDDVEVTEHADGSWEVTGLLAGPPALVPRLGGKLGRGLEERWRRLGLQERDRLVPWRIGVGLVAELGAASRCWWSGKGCWSDRPTRPPRPGTPGAA